MLFPAPDEQTWVGMLRLVLSVPDARSLKDKRRVVSQVRGRLRARHNLTVAETGHLDALRRGVLVGLMVGNDPRFLRSALDSIHYEVTGWRGFLVADSQVTVLRLDDEFDQNKYDEWDDG